MSYHNFVTAIFGNASQQNYTIILIKNIFLK
jgi:hypothetical protein